MLATTFILKLPFGSPGKTKVVEGADVKGAGISGLPKLLAAPALLPIFVLLLQNGYYNIGLIGGYTIVMLFFVDALPIRPLEGKRVFRWSKGIWLMVFCFSAFLLFAWQQVWVSYDVFLLLGVLALVAVLAVVSRKSQAFPLTNDFTLLIVGIGDSGVSRKSQAFPLTNARILLIVGILEKFLHVKESGNLMVYKDTFI